MLRLTELRHAALRAQFHQLEVFFPSFLDPSDFQM